MRQTAWWRPVALCLAALTGMSCGLIEQDVTTLRYKLMPIRYTLDTRQLGVPEAFWRTRCSEQRNECCQIFNCGIFPLTCEENACVANSPLENYATISLKAQAPALTRSGVQSFARLYVTRLTYDVENGINMALPQIDLFLGPDTAMTPQDPGVARFATVPPTPTGSRVTGQSIEVSAEARELFAQYARASDTFNLIMATAPVTVSSTSAPLRGRAVMLVTIELSGSLDL